jgi:MFS family permease
MYILVFPAVTMPIVSSLGLPLEEVVKLSFLMYLFYGLGALPAGYIVDRWEAKTMMLFGVFAMGAGLLLAGVFPSPRTMPASLLIVGIGASIYHPAGLALISRTVQRRGYALAINGVYGNLGIAAAPFITGVLTWLFSWQVAFVVLGATSMAASLLLGMIHVDESLQVAERDSSRDGSGMAKYFVILCFALVLGGLTYRGNTVLLPAYLELKAPFFRDLIQSLSFLKTQGTGTLAATILTSLVFLMGIFGQILGGRLADRYDLRYAYLVVHAAAVPFLLGMAFTTNYWLAVCAGFFVLFSLGMQPIENSLIAALTPHRWRSTGFAVKFILNFGIGASAVYLVGLVRLRYPLEAVYIVLSGIAALLVISIVVLIASSRRIRRLKN